MDELTNFCVTILLMIYGITNCCVCMLSKVGAGGRKSRLLLPMSTSAELCEKLTEFGEYYTSLGPPNPNASGEEGLLKSAVITKETRRYYLDLKENRRGRFLRVWTVLHYI